MKKIIYTPHDRYFRSSMSHPQVARQFFETHLPEKIRQMANLDTLWLRQDTYVDEDLQLSMTDMVFSVELQGKPGYFYILTEHQSKSDPLMPFRLLKYMSAIMTQHLKETQGTVLPLVYPIVLYAGDKPYHHSTDLFDLFGEHEPLAREIFLKPFHLVDVTQIPDETLRQKTWLSIMLMCLKHTMDRTDILQWIDPLVDNINTVEVEGGFDFAKASFTYLFETGEASDPKQLSHLLHGRLSPTLEETTMTTMAQYFRQEGVQQGVRQGEAAIILRQMQCRFGDVPKAYEQRITQANADTLLQLGEKILEAKTLADIFEESELE